jgi:hypothetical protein
LQAEAIRTGTAIPARLPPDTSLFNIPDKLYKILDRDLAAAGIPKRDDRGRTLDVHALRTTFGTLMSKGGVAPRTAQAAMRHSDIRLTMGVYTDPRSLDVRGALDALPSLTLDHAGREALRATGTDARTVAPTVAPTSDKRSTQGAIPVKMAGNGISGERGNFSPQLHIPSMETAGCHQQTTGRECRGDWIRTSDLLNPIKQGQGRSSRRMSQMQAI